MSNKILASLYAILIVTLTIIFFKVSPNFLEYPKIGATVVFSLFIFISFVVVKIKDLLNLD